MPAKRTPPDLLTVPQAAKFLRTTRQAVWNAIKKGRLKVRRYGHVSLISRSVLKEYSKTRKPGRPVAKNKG